VLEARVTRGPVNLLAWQWYWVDGMYTTNAYWAKVLQARSLLMGRPDDAAVVIAYASDPGTAGEGRRVLDEFVGAMLPAITRSIEYARR
jgi:EpsI family protein